MTRAFDLLKRNNAPEALKLGQLLEDRRFSGGFEIQALALHDLHRRQDAITVLERGVATVPTVWPLWQLLGNYRSDEGEFESAFTAYERALELECDEASLQFNYANALLRSKQWELAKARLQPLIEARAPDDVDPELGGLIIERYYEILIEQGRHDDAEGLLDEYAGVLARAKGIGRP